MCSKSSISVFANLSKEYFVKPKPFGNYALLVTFNFEPKPIVVEFIKHFYGDFFKFITFCGVNITSKLNEERGYFKKFDSYSFIELDVVAGYFHYYCMTKAIEMGLHVDGILLMSDDVMLKYWNLEKAMDLSKIQYNVLVKCKQEVRTDFKPNWAWWFTSHGIPGLIKMFDYMNAVRNGSIYLEGRDSVERISKYLATLESNYDSKSNYSKACMGGSDIFYLPKSKFKDFHFISNIYRNFEIFLEIAVPTILSGLAPANESLATVSRYIWDFQLNFPTNYHLVNLFYHPIKVSVVANNSMSNFGYCNYFIKDKIEYDLGIKKT